MEEQRRNSRAEQELGSKVQAFRIKDDDERVDLRGEWGLRATRKLEAGEVIGLYAGLCMREKGPPRSPSFCFSLILRSQQL
eukprot:1759239-Rhodomonas_salina.1